jgi:putative ABC transport system substrate-binding protein
MRRRDFLIAAIGAVTTWPVIVHAQRPKNIPRLCFLTFDPDASRSTRFGPFFDGLRDLGYVDGQTISIDYLSANGDGERFPALAAECVRLKSDIIVASTTPATQVAKNTTRTIPIVMLALADPVAAGLVDSVARPGANVTGSSMMVSELSAKRLALLKEAAPKISRVLVLAYPADPIAAVQVKALKEAAPSLGLMLRVQDVHTAEDLSAAFDAGANEGAEGLIVGAESIFLVNRARVGELAARYRLPAIYPFSIQVTDGGGLMAYDPNIPNLQRHAAIYVDRILKGEKPSDLPIEQPTEFGFVINLKVAKTLGLSIPESILQRADEVIE